MQRHETGMRPLDPTIPGIAVGFDALCIFPRDLYSCEKATGRQALRACAGSAGPQTLMALMPTYDCARSSDSAITKDMRLAKIHIRRRDLDDENTVASLHCNLRDTTIDHDRRHAARTKAREEFAAETSSSF